MPRLCSSVLAAMGLAYAVAAQQAPVPPTDLSSPASPDVQLEPVPDPSLDRQDPKNIETTRNITMVWNQTDSGSIEVKSSMQLPTVVLENIASIKDVNCDDKSLKVTFKDDNSRNEAKDKWPQNEFLVVTNTKGQCDEPQERGVYITSNPRLAQGSPTIEFDRRRTNFNETVDSMEININSITSPAQLTKRVDIDVNASLNKSFEIPSIELTAATSPFSVDVFPGQASFDLVFTGKVKMDSLSVTECWFDIKSQASVNMGVGMALQAEFSQNLNQSLGRIPITPVHIPNVLTIGPAIEPSVGLELVATGKVKAEFEVAVGYKEAQFHLDVLDRAKTFATPFEPFFNGSANFGASLQVEASPYLDVKFAMQVDTIVGGARAGLGSTFKLKNSLLVEARSGGPDQEQEKPKGKVAFPAIPGKSSGRSGGQSGKPADAGKPLQGGIPQGGKPGQVDQKKTDLAVGKEDPVTCTNGASLKTELNMAVYAFADASTKSFGDLTGKYTFVDQSWELYQQCYAFAPSNTTSFKVDQPKPIDGRKPLPMPPLSEAANTKACTNKEYLRSFRQSARNLADARKEDEANQGNTFTPVALKLATELADQCFDKEQTEAALAWAANMFGREAKSTQRNKGRRKSVKSRQRTP